MSKIIKAARLAHKAHAGQKRDVSGDDYIKHPGRVAADLILLDGVDGLEIGEDEVAAAWCHDTVEDTTVTRTDLERELGLKVAILVDDVTNRFTSKLCPNMNRATRKARQNVLHEATDVANFVMMTADVCGALGKREPCE
jgi:(p)ppGpp synthase/HD superfamily hydrolase